MEKKVDVSKCLKNKMFILPIIWIIYFNLHLWFITFLCNKISFKEKKKPFLFLFHQLRVFVDRISIKPCGKLNLGSLKLEGIMLQFIRMREQNGNNFLSELRSYRFKYKTFLHHMLFKSRKQKYRIYTVGRSASQFLNGVY